MIVDAILCDFRFWTTFSFLAGVYLLWPCNPLFPVVNTHPNDFSGRKARDHLNQNAGQLITEGLAKHGTPITFKLPYGMKVVLPASLAGWVKSNKDLDHKELVRQDFMAGYPGFESQTTLHAEDETLKAIIRTKMGPNASIIPIMSASLHKAIALLWGDDEAWHNIDWYKDTMAIVARGASSVFVGPEKSDDVEWLDLVQNYTLTFFASVGDLHAYPPWSRSIVQWFLPNPTTCRKLVTRARVIMNDVLQQREKDAAKAAAEGRTPSAYNDALAWTQAAGAKAEAGDIQLSLAMAGLFTTSEAFRQTLIEIARNPDIAEAIEKEATEQITTHGITLAALSNMVLLDSVMKEAQRISSAKVALERIALKDTKLPTGQLIPSGTHIMVDCTNLWDPEAYPNPYQFDAYRFLRRREAGDTSSQFVQSGSDYHVFGGGRHICPGRFFANNLMKLAICHILLKYNIRLKDGCSTDVVPMGFYTMVNPGVQLKVQKKKAGVTF